MPPTANSFEFADWLAMESLRQLLNPIEIGPFFNTSYNSEFTKAYPIGASCRVPFPKQFLVDNDNTLGYTPQAIVERHTDVTIDKVAKAHFEWDSIERALKMARGREKIAKDIIKPAMTTIRNKIEVDCEQGGRKVDYEPDVEWTVPQDWDRCILLVRAKRGSTFAFYEFQ